MASFSNAMITSPYHLRPVPFTPSPSPRAFTITSCSHNKPVDAGPLISLDRRSILIGLTGLSATTAATHLPVPPASASAQVLPNCHLPSPNPTIDYTFPATGPLRIRRPAHLLDADYINKYQEALRLMKSLPSSNPCNFYTHAQNHLILAHDNNLFLPWHRFYIHFYERILGNLINDPTFALPFWNFDTPAGMSLPALFLDPSSSLYNPTRDPAHLPPAMLDFWYVYGAAQPAWPEAQAMQEKNVKELRNAFRQSLGRASLFMGDPPKEEGDLGSAGRIDSIHKAIHQWVGPAEAPWMDMGNIHMSTRDPVFYSLHGNLDRLWEIYRRFRGGGPDFEDEAYLDAEFKFHDENGQLVRVKVRDCLDPLKMGYTYEDVPNPWAGHNDKVSYVTNQKTKPTTPLTQVSEFGSSPRKLNAPVRVLVPRPKAARTNLEKLAEVEVLHLNGIDVVPSGPGRFDIYLSAPLGDSGDHAGPDYGEFAGSYVKPFRVHSAKEAEEAAKVPLQGKRRKGSLTLGITPLLEDMDAEDAEKIVVTLVPTDGDITVDGIGIKLLPTDRQLLL